MFRQRSESIPESVPENVLATNPLSETLPAGLGRGYLSLPLAYLLAGGGGEPPGQPQLGPRRAGLSEWPLSRLKMDLLRTPRSVSLSLSQRLPCKRSCLRGCSLRRSTLSHVPSIQKAFPEHTKTTSGTLKNGCTADGLCLARILHHYLPFFMRLHDALPLTPGRRAKRFKGKIPKK